MQTQTLSLKRTLKGITILGYLGANGKVYSDKFEAQDTNKRLKNQNKFNQIVNDIKNVYKAAKLTQQLADAKQQLKKHYSFAAYCLVCTCKRLLKAFKLTLDKLAKQMLF